MPIFSGIASACCAPVLIGVIGLAIILLTLSGKLSMEAGEETITRTIQMVALTVTMWVEQIPFLDWLFVILAGWGLYGLYKKIWKK